jgi:putative acetyltransferase
MIEVRIATGADVDRVRSVYLCAFPEGERDIVTNLAVALLSEDASPNIISLVAEVKGAIVGHVAYSPVTLENGKKFRGFILAPLAVRPEWQKQGTGSQLVRDGIQRLSSMGVEIVFVYGDPKYYGRFGFTVQAAERFEPPYTLQHPFGWQAMSLAKPPAEKAYGRIACVKELGNPVLW